MHHLLLKSSAQILEALISSPVGYQTDSFMPKDHIKNIVCLFLGYTKMQHKRVFTYLAHFMASLVVL